MGDEGAEFFRAVRDKYKNKFGNKTFRMRLCYPDDFYKVTSETVKHI